MHRLDFIGLLVVALLVGTHDLASPRGRAVSPANIIGAVGTSSVGSLDDGTLIVDLVARRGYRSSVPNPDEQDLILAFGELGKSLQVPGPTVRVTSGTHLRVTVRNATSETLIFRGWGVRGIGDSLVIPPGARRTVGFRATVPGSYTYVGIPIERAETAAVPASALEGLLVVQSGDRGWR